MEDFVRIWNDLHVQSSLMPDDHREMMLEITVPMSYAQDTFRVGWSLKNARTDRWLAISSGLATWGRDDLPAAAKHVQWLLEACDALVSDRIIPERG